MTFKEQLDAALSKIEEGHHYLRRTSNSAEKRVQRANERSMRSSGLPGFPSRNNQYKMLLKQTENQRPLRRSEFIALYGYDAWREYVAKNNLPETHKWADAH